jgi:TonB family protein
MPAPRVRVVVRWRPPRTLRARCTLASIAAHAIGALALVLAPALGRDAPRAPDAFAVELVQLPGRRAAPAARPATAAASARPDAPPKKQAPVKLPDPTTKTKKAPPAKRDPPRREPEPPSSEPSTSAAPASSSPSPAAPAAQAGDASGNVAALEFGGSELAWYRAALSQALYTQWRKPLLEGAREPLEVRVHFEILPDGQVRDVRVESTSGVPALDRSAMRAVVDAAPLPPLPRGYRDAPLPASCVFRLLPGES